ncbi:MAG TPA: ABC transporter permease [bacterium]|jgi:ABC-type lipoprotein release transport system permease subunit|nr:ABC transporter permease [bacterium]HQI05317.1 ABC transporter permease [bacterium]HQN74251.1 ABC transporter permease [bacterium]HQO92498.1 ABC transporter permease [bacterium]
MILFKMALRNLLKQKRRSLFTALSMVIGYTLMCVIIGLMDGGFGNIVKSFTQAKTGHVQIHHREYLDKPGLFKNYEWNKKLEDAVFSVPSVKNVSPRLFSGALAFIDKKTTAVQLKGIVPDLEAGLTALDKKIEKGRYLSNGEKINEAVITNSLAEILKAEVGSELILISQGADGSIANDRFTVCGILVKDLDSLENNTVFLPLDTAQEYLTLIGRIHETAVITDDYRDSFKSSLKISRAIFSAGIKDVSSEPWEVVEQSFYAGVVAKKEGNSINIMVIMLIVGIAVLNTVLMSILERMREYGVMKAMGTSPWFIFNSIIIEIAMLSLFSSVLGFIFGYAATYYLHVHGIVYPEPVSIGGIVVRSVTSEFAVKSFVLPLVTVVLTGIAAAVFPAYIAASNDPVKSMRSY